jgi:hypothetical protein
MSTPYVDVGSIIEFIQREAKLLTEDDKDDQDMHLFNISQGCDVIMHMKEAKEKDALK